MTVAPLLTPVNVAFIAFANPRVTFGYGAQPNTGHVAHWPGRTLGPCTPA
jgi:hypothetical protein